MRCGRMSQHGAMLCQVRHAGVRHRNSDDQEPILIAAGLASLLHSPKVAGWTRAIGVGRAAGRFHAVSDRLYTFAQGVEPVQLLALDAGHQLACFLVGSAVLGLMKPA
jgi:hypothetical protein